MEIYPTYQEREDAKRVGWKKIEETQDAVIKAYVFMHYIVWSHYWRAREAIESSPKPKSFLRKIRGSKYYKHYTLDIDHYTKHWMWANSKLLSEDVLLAIEDRFGYEPEENKLLPEGHTNYLYQ